MIIQHNIMALNSHNRLSSNNNQVGKNLEKLSSGYKINRAGDDAAGLAISEKMRAQITGLTRASQNAQDGVSLVQTAEGQLTEVHSMLNRMVDLATQSSNGTYDGAVDRKNLQKEVQALKDEIDRIATTSNFNGIKLLDGSLGGGAAGALPTADVKGFATTAPTVGKDAAVAYAREAATLGVTSKSVEITYKDATGAAQTVKTAVITTAGDADEMMAEIKKDTKFSALFETTVVANKLVFTAKTAGVTKAEITTLKEGVDGTTFATTNTLGTATAGTAASTTVTLKANMAAGDKLVINGKTYEMAAVKDDAARKFTSAAELKAQLDTDGVTMTGNALTNTTKLSFTTKAGAGAAAGGGLNLQIGDTSEAAQRITISVGDMSVTGLLLTDVDVSDETKANASIQLVKDAINSVSGTRADLGAAQNRLEHTINNLATTTENMTAAESRIRDTDMAKEMMTFTKNNVLAQAAQAMLAQANQQPQQVLQLLR